MPSWSALIPSVWEVNVGCRLFRNRFFRKNAVCCNFQTTRSTCRLIIRFWSTETVLFCLKQLGLPQWRSIFRIRLFKSTFESINSCPRFKSISSHVQTKWNGFMTARQISAVRRILSLRFLSNATNIPLHSLLCLDWSCYGWHQTGWENAGYKIFVYLPFPGSAKTGGFQIFIYVIQYTKLFRH